MSDPKKRYMVEVTLMLALEASSEEEAEEETRRLLEPLPRLHVEVEQVSRIHKKRPV